MMVSQWGLTWDYVGVFFAIVLLKSVVSFSPPFPPHSPPRNRVKRAESKQLAGSISETILNVLKKQLQQTLISH